MAGWNGRRTNVTGILPAVDPSCEFQFAAFSFRLNRLGGMLFSISLAMNL